MRSVGGKEKRATLRCSRSIEDLETLEPLWGALQEHHAAVLPTLGKATRPRGLAEAWSHRRAKYERWLEDPETFVVLAEEDGRAIGYGFVTVGAAFAGWRTGRLASLETLSVLPECRGSQVGAQLLEAAWARLEELGVDEMLITTAVTNLDSHRFYERHGFEQSFVIYYGKRKE